MEMLIAGTLIFIILFMILSKIILFPGTTEEILVKNKNERMKDLYRSK